MQAAIEDVVVRTDDFRNEPRWPQYAPACVEIGILSGLSFKLYTAERTSGALNLFSRNELCTPIPHPDQSLDWLRITLSDNVAQSKWLQDPDLMEWLESARLNVVRGLFPLFPDKPRVREKAVGAITATMHGSNEKLAELMQASAS